MNNLIPLIGEPIDMILDSKKISLYMPMLICAALFC